MKTKVAITILLTILIPITVSSEVDTVKTIDDSNIPVATKMLLDAAGESGRSAVKSVYMIYCPKTDSKGTGFLIKSGHIITNEHVIRGNTQSEIKAQSSFGDVVTFSSLIIDAQRDIAILKPSKELKGGLELHSDDSLLTGTSLATWGFPLGYNGPAPLLSVGYLSGFSTYYTDTTKTKIVKHLVVNGAFNPGNSGGPLFISNTNKVVGIVVSKHAPISDFHKSAIEALSKNSSGVVFTATDGKGNKKEFVESQIVADLLKYFRDLTQVMIGEAISVSELKNLLSEKKIKY